LLELIIAALPRTAAKADCEHSLRIKTKNMLRIVDRPRLKARKKRLTKQKLSLQRKDARVDVFDDLVTDP